MAMTGNHSPRHSSDNLQSRRATRLPTSSPWNQVVRGESEPVAAAPSSPPPVEPFPSAAAPMDDSRSAAESSDNGGERNVGNAKRPAWSKPSANGAASEVRPVMDARSWPALSEAAKATAKLESSKGLLDASSVSESQGVGSMPSSSSQRQVGDNASGSNLAPTRHKPIKHSSSNASSNGGHPQQSAPQVSVAVMGSHNYSPKDHTHRSGFGSNDQPQQQRNSFRNRYGGPHQRGDGGHHNNYGNRRDQDWNTHRNFNGRDMHMPPRVAPRMMRPSPPPNSAQFIHPPPLRPFGGHVGFHELAPPVVFVAAPPPPPDSLRGVPFVPPMPHHPLFFTGPEPEPDPQLHPKIVNQIDYYFSNANLVKDIFLRQNMDDLGWVPIKLISGFKKVMHLTDDIQVILDAVQTSSVVEVQGDKIRRRKDWEKWIMPPPVQSSSVKTLEALNHDVLAEQMHNTALETANYDSAEGRDVVPDNSQQNKKISTGESASQVSDISTRN